MSCNDPSLKVVIPARHGSSRLPGKPLVNLAGRPLVVRVFEAVTSALRSADVVVAADDARTMSVLEEHNIPAVLTGTGHESGMDRCAEAARLLGYKDDTLVINVQGDEPLIPKELLSAFVKFCATQNEISIATISAPIDSIEQIADPNIVKLTVDNSSRAISFSRAPIPFCRDRPMFEWRLADYLRHVGIYAYRNELLQQISRSAPVRVECIEKLEQLRFQWLGIPIQVMHWHAAPPPGVDTPEDVSRISHFFQEAIT